MKKVFVALMIAVMGLSVGMADVQAKRMGGGGSFGKNSFGAARQAQSPTKPAAIPAKPAAPAAAGAAAASPWKNILGGALLGLGLGALLSHLGMGGALASMISTILMVALLGLAAMFIFRMIRRRTEGNGAQPAFSNAGNRQSSGTPTPQIGSLLEKSAQAPQGAQAGAFGGGAAAAGQFEQAPEYGIPADFDAVGFARNAKTYFIRLQAAWDKADLNDIREFTTPEMFAEIKMQIQERGAAENHTDVVSIDAEVLGVETIGNDYLASVRFYGFIKEDVNAAPAQFTEIWNLAKPVSGTGGWVLAGIQQVS